MKPPAFNKYPRRLTIGQEEYKLRFVKVIARDNNLLGLYDPSSRTIYVRNDQSPGEIFYTFVHEVLHAFEEEYEIKLSHRVVYQLERAIGDFILNNF